MTPSEETAWLAGLLDGEGCFGYYGTPRVSVGMTDKDVVDRAAALMGTQTRPRKGPTLPHWKPQWVAEVNGDRAAEVMERVLPILGQRRSARVREVLARHKEAREFTCGGCGETFARRSAKRIHCSPRCGARVRRRAMEVST